jgi:hypothetical protein
MRRWASIGVLVAALIAADTAGAETPVDVYSDYAGDGVLSCGHSRAALKGVLNDASIYQYGDPFTMVGLKLAVRKQLAGSCRREERAASGTGSTAPVGGEAPTAGSGREAGGRKSSGESKSPDPRDSSTSAEPRTDAVASVPANNGRQDGWMVLLGVVLLLLTLGSGGWAARRALTD